MKHYSVIWNGEKIRQTSVDCLASGHPARIAETRLGIS